MKFTGEVCFCIIDHSQAFDKAPHTLSLAKINNFGLSLIYFKWFQIFLHLHLRKVPSLLSLTWSTTKFYLGNFLSAFYSRTLAKLIIPIFKIADDLKIYQEKVC
jgi:hypothetical protein